MVLNLADVLAYREVLNAQEPSDERDSCLRACRSWLRWYLRQQGNAPEPVLVLP
jgi:hypothetical protein